ncbi:MAG TPA: hypothetical protein VIY48_09345 [Candidatus Paceibacterota bacterium]
MSKTKTVIRSRNGATHKAIRPWAAFVGAQPDGSFYGLSPADAVIRLACFNEKVRERTGRRGALGHGLHAKVTGRSEASQARRNLTLTLSQSPGERKARRAMFDRIMSAR